MHMNNLASIQFVLWNILEKYNQDPAGAFKQVQLDPILMQQPGARYPLRKIAALWEETERRIPDPCFGLNAATYWHPSNFGTLGYAMLVSRSLRITLERLIRFHRVISDAHFGELHEDREHEALIFSLTYEDGAPYSRAREDALLAWIMSMLRINFQQELAPLSVQLTHSRPDCAGKYSEFFQAPVRFNSHVANLALPLSAVDRVLPGANEELARGSEQVMSQYLTDLDSLTLISRVKKIIIEHLPSGDATVEKTAAELGYGVRTLQRLLKQEKTTFIALLNHTREKLARQYVQDKTMDLTEIAFLLGFAELSTFSRSFKRWTGKSPATFRKVA